MAKPRLVQYWKPGLRVADAAPVGPPWLTTSSGGFSPAGAAGIAAFVADMDVDPSALKDRLAARLPSYMVPRELRLAPELPLNANGKCDRGALIRILEES